MCHKGLSTYEGYRVLVSAFVGYYNRCMTLTYGGKILSILDFSIYKMKVLLYISSPQMPQVDTGY